MDTLKLDIRPEVFQLDLCPGLMLPGGLGADEEVDTNLVDVLGKGVVAPAVPAFLAASEGWGAEDAGEGGGWPRYKRV
jgi:hypothetical protein